MTSSRAEALMLLPDWARRLSAKGAVDFTETLQGTWRRDGEELDRPIVPPAAPPGSERPAAARVRRDGTGLGSRRWVV